MNSQALSFLLLLRNRESVVASMVRTAADIGSGLAESGEGGFAIVAVDERSGDNTLSHLSLLQARIPQLRILHDVARGRALQAAARAARGRHWIVLEDSVDPAAIRWGLWTVQAGTLAAMVPGELLVVDGTLARTDLGAFRGGLRAAQRTIERAVRAHHQRPALRPSEHGLAGRAGAVVLRLLGRDATRAPIPDPALLTRGGGEPAKG